MSQAKKHKTHNENSNEIKEDDAKHNNIQIIITPPPSTTTTATANTSSSPSLKRHLPTTTASSSLDHWSVDSWRGRPIDQQPEYEDQEGLKKALQKIQSLPPLVHFQEIDHLKNKLADVIEI